MDVPTAVMDLSKIDKSLLWHAVTDHSGINYYLNIETGEILDDLEGDLDEEMLESDNFVYIEPISSREAYTFMEDFIMTVKDLELKRRLEIAINERGAFRRFWQTLQDYPEEKRRWIAFEEKKIDQYVDKWVENLALDKER